ncbi:MAG: M28 family peptidase [Ktedonobacterales bacterium]
MMANRQNVAAKPLMARRAPLGALALVVALLLAACAPFGQTSHAPTQTPPPLPTVGAQSLNFPAVDPNYIYQQLFHMVTTWQQREAGYNTNPPGPKNGHDGFAQYWAQEMQRDLAGFGPTVRRDSFQIDGWTGRPASIPAVNVEVTVPGVTHPDQVVVIGCHYDGEASSTQSANDDASGCAIELGVAKALGQYWQAHHLYPARTLRFVIFDAEEQGVFGSFHYLNSTINGDTANVTAMFNEEQSGIAYPLRFLGKMSNPLLPLAIELSPLDSSQLYPAQSKLPASQRDAITRFQTEMRVAVPVVFAAFQQLGFSTLTYWDASGKAVTQPVFSSDQVSNIQPQPDQLGGSDQIPFTLAGLPDATFVGNATYYDRNPPPWSYPFDQPQDTIQLMNVFASGHSQQAQALTLALALPGMLTTAMLTQPDVLGYTQADGKPIAAISDIGPTVAGQPLALDASATYDPASSAAAPTYSWTFGDGATASGVSVQHTYAQAGAYTLTLTVHSAHGARVIRKTIAVATHALTYANPYAAYPQNGVPPTNPAVTLPTPQP